MATDLLSSRRATQPVAMPHRGAKAIEANIVADFARYGVQ
jgi:hypothetical protein